MHPRKTPRSTAERLLRRSNQPILVLAILAVVLYILELFRLIPRAWMTPFLWLNFLIDFIFLVDLSAKCIILGRGYLRSPWFFIDFISTLPIISSSLELLGQMGPQLQATRVARGARVARIARVARVARLAKVARVARLATAIRANRGLQFLKTESGSPPTPRFNRALFIGVPVLLTAFVLASSYLTSTEVNALRERLTARVNQAQSKAELEQLRAAYPAAEALYPAIEVMAIDSPLEGGQKILLSLSPAYARADRLSGILLLLVLVTIAVSVWTSSALAGDRSAGRERSILSQCFSPAIVQKFYSSPEVIERFYRQWMSVFFIDVRGFTKAAEREADDIEGLALKLRRVMDTARDEIVITHEGVIDKFIGDAVMGWVGGHFSAHWELLSRLRRQLCLDELELIRQDIRSIERELEPLDVSGNQLPKTHELRGTLEDARRRERELTNRRETALDQDPTLKPRYDAALQEYRRRVARSAVNCCLRIAQAVENIEDPEGFHDLKIGIASGSVLVGNFGATDQIGFTVLGPAVNRAARLEPASAQCGCKLLVDQETYELLRDLEEFRFRRLPLIALRGIADRVITYEPFFTDQVQESFLEYFERGVAAIETDQLEEAIACFERADQLRPNGDVAARLWSAECVRAREAGRPVGVKAMKK